MYRITKRAEFSAAHRLHLDYNSPCTNLHGHNWIVDIRVDSPHLDRNGMVVDFARLKDIVRRLDHQEGNIGEVIGCNPTAENIARWIAEQIRLTRPGLRFSFIEVKVQETEGNTASYCEDGGED